MAKSKFATVTPYVRDEFTSLFMIAMLSQGMKERTHIVEEEENEMYARFPNKSQLGVQVGDFPIIPSESPREDGSSNFILFDENVDQKALAAYLSFPWMDDEKGSSWIISTSDNHGMHTHDHSEEHTQLSKRRILFVTDKGFSMEIIGTSEEDGSFIPVVENIEIPSYSIVELEFDGKYAHRFRAVKGGKVLAMSYHPLDKSQKSTTLGEQTDKHRIAIPPTVAHVQITPPRLGSSFIIEAAENYSNDSLLSSFESMADLIQLVVAKRESEPHIPQTISLN